MKVRLSVEVEGNLCFEIVGVCRCGWCEYMPTLARSRPQLESTYLIRKVWEPN